MNNRSICRSRLFCTKSRQAGVVILVISIFIFLSAQYGYCAARRAGCVEPVAEQGYEYTVVAENLSHVDNLVIASDGLLYATLELVAPYGKVVRLDPDGKVTSVLKGLDRPDGLKSAGNSLYVVEESRSGRILKYDFLDGKLRTVARIKHLEGLVLLPSKELIVSKDRKKGKLYKVSVDGKIEVLIDGLRRPEGIAIDKDGSIYIAETATGRVLKLKDKKIEVLLEGLTEPDQLAFDVDGALLITEDASPGRLFKYKNAKLTVIADCLTKPQGILPTAGGILVSEQGRNRILRFTRK